MCCARDTVEAELLQNITILLHSLRQNLITVFRGKQENGSVVYFCREETSFIIKHSYPKHLVKAKIKYSSNYSIEICLYNA